MLSGAEILKQIKNKNIVIEPFNEEQINPNSYNLTLGDELFVYTDKVLDCAKQNSGKIIKITEEGYTLKPGEFYLATTNEKTLAKTFVPQISGRSSVGRIGLTVHMSAGLGSVGYQGKWILGLTCIVPVKIYPKMQIGQIYYFPIEGEYTDSYKSRYANIDTPVSSRSYLDFN